VEGQVAKGVGAEEMGTGGVGGAGVVPKPGTAKPSPSPEWLTGPPREQCSHGAPEFSPSLRPTLGLHGGSAIRLNFESRVVSSLTKLTGFHRARPCREVGIAGQNPAVIPPAR